MSESKLSVVIMAGGAGTRFWPVSTEKRPKQFLKLLGERSLLQMSYDRVADLVPPERVLVLTNQRFSDLVYEQLPELPKENVIGEPHRRDTAAAVALAAGLCAKRFGKDSVMAVLTADHRILPVENFQRALASAAEQADANRQALYTFGIPPTYPATGYGYLHRGETLSITEFGNGDQIAHYRLQSFKEKPDAATAERYVEAQEYYWNSGMFVWSVSAIAAELERQLPAHVRGLAPAINAWGSASFEQALADAFDPLESTSIDFGVMEHAQDVRCVVADFDWSDVGGWLALEAFLEQADGNAHRGHLHSADADNNIVFCEDSSEHVALYGVDNLIVVRSGNRTLVMPRNKAEAIKALVKQLDDSVR